MLKVSSYSTCIAAAVKGLPQRGIIHSTFDAAANILFPADFVLSLNAASSSSQPTPGMPNGLQLTAPPGTFPFSALRAGMPVLFGSQRLHIEAIGCSLDLSLCSQWNPHIERPAVVDMELIRKNKERLREYVSARAEMGSSWEWGLVPARCGLIPSYEVIDISNDPDNGLAPVLAIPGQDHGDNHFLAFPHIHDMAQFLCGRGVGLTPTGDDMLVGWMAAGWLLYGPVSSFLAACQQIVEVAKQQTHMLSQCWLRYAAQGNVALPICRLLDALTRDDESQLLMATDAVLALGATSGYDVIQGILLMLNGI